MRVSITRAVYAGAFLFGFAPVGMLWGYGQQPAHLEEFLIAVWSGVGLFILFQFFVFIAAFLDLKNHP
ncbi:MAG: hypothetical protein WCK51_09665 [Armatimonadota bacterium]